MKSETSLLAECISAIQYMRILLLRTDPEKFPPIYPKQITNAEVNDIISGLLPPMRELPEELQEMVKVVRKLKYNIQ